MGASISNLSEHKKGLIIGAVVSFMVVVAIILGTLGGIGLLTTDEPEKIDVPIGSMALFSPLSNGQVWKKVYDSMMTQNKCFINIGKQITSSSLKKIVKYQVDNGMLPIDNPFSNSIDVPVSECSEDGTRLVLTLDLSSYGGINPFKQGDSIYIFGVQGETEANTVMDGPKVSKPRYVYATNKEYPKYVPLQNQIMISDINPCNYNNQCTLDNSTPLFSTGTYTGGGTVRLTGNDSTLGEFIQHKPLFMFYIYMAYMNYPFPWPYVPLTVSQVYSSYSLYYIGFIQWYANLPQTCTQVSYIDNTTAGFVSGAVTVSGGSGTGIKMYLIDLGTIGLLMVTDDGSGYKNGDSITITQGFVSATVNIEDTNCSQPMYSLSGPIFLSYKTTKQQLKNLINYALSVDSSINTIVMYSNTTTNNPDNYNDPNSSILFFNTTPDTTGMHASNYSGYQTTTPVCVCNGRQDQIPNIFFPMKINQCADQVIYTSDTNITPYDFIANADTLIGSCNVTICT